MFQFHDTLPNYYFLSAAVIDGPHEQNPNDVYISYKVIYL